MKKLVATSTFALLLVGCTTVSIKPVDSNSYKPEKVCIKRNPRVIVPGFSEILEEAFKRHGIDAATYDDLPAQCEFSMTYTATQKWDGSMILNDVHLVLYKGSKIIGVLDRDAPSGLFGGGGFSLNKWGSAQSKMDPLMDQFLSGFAKQ